MLKHRPSLLNHIDENGYTIVVYTMKYDKPDRFDYVLSLNPDLSLCDDDKQNILHHAILSKNIDAIQKLIAKGFSKDLLNAEDKYDNRKPLDLTEDTAIINMFKAVDEQLVNERLKEITISNLITVRSEVIEIIYSKKPNLEKVKSICLKHPEVLDNEYSNNLLSPYTPLLTLAACYDNAFVVSKLIELGADINYSSNDGLTALEVAVLEDSYNAVAVLLEHQELTLKEYENLNQKYLNRKGKEVDNIRELLLNKVNGRITGGLSKKQAADVQDTQISNDFNQQSNIDNRSPHNNRPISTLHYYKEVIRDLDTQNLSAPNAHDDSSTVVNPPQSLSKVESRDNSNTSTQPINSSANIQAKADTYKSRTKGIKLFGGIGAFCGLLSATTYLASKTRLMEKLPTKALQQIPIVGNLFTGRALNIIIKAEVGVSILAFATAGVLYHLRSKS